MRTPAGFIICCRPTVAARPPGGLGWAHELWELRDMCPISGA